MKLHTVQCLDSCKEEPIIRLFTKTNQEIPVYLCQTHFDLINKVHDLEKVDNHTYRRVYTEDDHYAGLPVGDNI